jgi:hypothetical protein
LTSIIGWVQLARENHEMSGETLVCVDESASLLRAFIEHSIGICASDMRR